MIITGRAIGLDRTNVDTDQIIPVRFLNSTSRHGHADSLFADWRSNPDFVLNQRTADDASVLVAGHDFGTGSSREYAVWALRDYGFKAVFSSRFGDIFRDNCFNNRLIAGQISEADSLHLLDHLDQSSADTCIDLQRMEIHIEGRSYAFSVPEYWRSRLLAGSDELDDTLARVAKIDEYEERDRRP